MGHPVVHQDQVQVVLPQVVQVPQAVPQAVLQVPHLVVDGYGQMPLENGSGQKLLVQLWRHLLVK